MILPLVKIGDPLLRRRCPAPRLTAPALAKIIRNMTATMRKADGVGLAANQVGLPLHLFVMESRGNRRYPKAAAFPLQCYLGARIIRRSAKKVKGWEGCLSIPGYRGQVPRHAWLTFTARTPQGERVTRTVRGFEARVVQHEIDHLNGFFYMDRMRGLKEWFHLDNFNLRMGRRVRDGKR